MQRNLEVQQNLHPSAEVGAQDLLNFDCDAFIARTYPLNGEGTLIRAVGA